MKEGDSLYLLLCGDLTLGWQECLAMESHYHTTESIHGLTQMYIYNLLFYLCLTIMSKTVV